MREFSRFAQKVLKCVCEFPLFLVILVNEFPSDRWFSIYLPFHLQTTHFLANPSVSFLSISVRSETRSWKDRIPYLTLYRKQCCLEFK